MIFPDGILVILSTFIFSFILREFISSVSPLSHSSSPLQCAVFLWFFSYHFLSPGEGNYLVENRLVIAVCVFTKLEPRQQGCFQSLLAQATVGKSSLSNPIQLFLPVWWKCKAGCNIGNLKMGLHRVIYPCFENLFLYLLSALPECF